MDTACNWTRAVGGRPQHLLDTAQWLNTLPEHRGRCPDGERHAWCVIDNAILCALCKLVDQRDSIESLLSQKDFHYGRIPR